jgi:hypothetical protein
VDANGRVYRKTYAIDPASALMRMEPLLEEVALIEGGHTFYARHGEVFAYLCAAATLLLWLGWSLLRYWRKRRGQSS